MVGHHADNLFVFFRLQDGKRQVFQLPLHARHTEAVRQRGDHVEGLLRLLRLFFRREEAHRAHVVQAVRNLNHQHSRILRHRHDHFADRFGLRRRAERDLVQLGHAVDQLGHFRAEVAGEVVERVVGVLHRVVQQRRHQRGCVHTDFGADRGHGEWVGDVRIARFTQYTFVQALRGEVRAVKELRVRLGVKLPVQRQKRVEHGVDPGAAVAGQRTCQTG